MGEFEAVSRLTRGERFGEPVRERAMVRTMKQSPLRKIVVHWTTIEYDPVMTKKEASFSDQIRKLIDDSGETRYRIALECGIDKGLMSRFMAGKATFSMETLDRLAKYLGWEVVAKPNKTKPDSSKTEK